MIVMVTIYCTLPTLGVLLLIVLSKILFKNTSEMFNIWLVYSSLYEPTRAWGGVVVKALRY
jgi:uncharacterized membrane protein YbaN (DUF454 family)